MPGSVSRRQAVWALAEAQVQVNAIAGVVQYSVASVRRWIQRAKTGAGVHDRPRSGRPAMFTAEAQLRMVAFYCQTQPLPGCGRWTLRWAAHRLKAEPDRLGASPSKSTLHRTLQSNRLKPHQSRYFLHITDPDFFPKLEHLVGLYRTAPPHLIFFDECPGIQILKRLTPDLQTETMSKRLEEFEYIRNGTMDVLAFLHHADGQVYLECHGDHQTATFLEVFRHHAERFPPTASLHYVMDNLSSHRGYPLCQLVAELSGIECPSEQALSTQAKRVQWLGRDDKRIVIHFTPYHGSWLNLIEIWFAIMGTKVLNESFGSPDQLKGALEAFMNDWNSLLAHPFRWSYDGTGLHEKAVRRFTKILQSSAGRMEIRVLTKQMMLLTNLLKDYFSEVSTDTWRQLSAAISLQSETLSDLIRQEHGPIRKQKAQQAAATLTAALQERRVLIEATAA
jgi:transposase